ncbi:MAG: hypothetical protein JST92_02045 [Deltaproteobacteria bacterium]|nr:hypothetical protein [Deltaproteobacteria bacterium]
MLFWVTLLCAALALVRLWPGLFVVAINQAGVLRALGNIEQYGQPWSQSFVPSGVFSLENLTIARNVFALCTLILAVAVTWPSRAREQIQAASLPRLPRWVYVPLGIYVLVVIVSKRTIFSVAYNEPDQVLLEFSLSGGHVFIMSAVLYEVLCLVRAGSLKPLWAFAGIVALFVATDYSKGQTGVGGGYLLAAAFACFGALDPADRPRRQRMLLLVGAVATMFVLTLGVRGVRASLAREGAGSVTSFVQPANDKEANTARTGEGAETFGNSVQYAAHVLECISLYEGGLSREWRSVYLPVVYTFEPSFLAGPLGFTRPREAAWELMDYYVHGGGIYVPGELYWNGGYLCVALVFAALIAFCRRCDVRYGASAAWLIMFAWFLPNLLQGIGYGFAQVSRGVFNGLLALAVWKVGAIVMRGRRRAEPPGVPQPPLPQQAR